MNNNWIFHDGVVNHTCASFPFAFRSMFNAIKKGVEAGKNYQDLVAKCKIISPLQKVYSHQRATELATDQGLLTTEGQINGREFKRR